MEVKPWYPEDFKFVLGNTLTEHQVDQYLRQPGCSPRFVYGMLMLPTVLRHFTGIDKDSLHLQHSMTQATLFGYKLYGTAESNIPIIARSSDPAASVEGVLILGLDDQQRSLIYAIEESMMKFVNVQVEILCQVNGNGSGSSARKIKLVDAGAFVWTDKNRKGLVPSGTTAWKMDKFLKSELYESIERSANEDLLESSVQSTNNKDHSASDRNANAAALEHPNKEDSAATPPSPDVVSESDSPPGLPINYPDSNLTIKLG